jgi:hypothetical protein
MRDGRLRDCHIYKSRYDLYGAESLGRLLQETGRHWLLRELQNIPLVTTWQSGE